MDDFMAKVKEGLEKEDFAEMLVSQLRGCRNEQQVELTFGTEYYKPKASVRDSALFEWKTACLHGAMHIKSVAYNNNSADAEHLYAFTLDFLLSRDWEG